jgi:predicted nuclease of predicted toxin-antitoxin system
VSIKIVIDMNLSPAWVSTLESHGWPAVHWATVGDPRATDRVVMDWAKANRYVVFTHDLDFGTMLALTHDTGPSVIRVRAQNVLPDHLGAIVAATLRQHEEALATGALIVVEERRNRVRILPLL